MTPGHVGSKSTDSSHLYPYSIEKMFDFWDPTENSEDQRCLCGVGGGCLGVHMSLGLSPSEKYPTISYQKSPPQYLLDLSLWACLCQVGQWILNNFHVDSPFELQSGPRENPDIPEKGHSTLELSFLAHSCGEPTPHPYTQPSPSLALQTIVSHLRDTPPCLILNPWETVAC